MNVFSRRSRKRLPGSLCDETPVPTKTIAEPGPWKPRNADTIKLPPVAAAAKPIETRPIPEILKLRQQLADITADRDALETANGRLVARLRMARTLLADFGAPEQLVAELDRADRIDEHTVRMPRVRSLQSRQN